MGLDWSKSRRRQQSHAARQSEIEDSRYLAELGGWSGDRRMAVKAGPVTLNCTCGHKGRVNTAVNKRFRCSKCGRLWAM